MAVTKHLLILITGLFYTSCHFHPRPGQVITVHGWYNSKMYSYFIPSAFPEERWSLAGDGGFASARIAVFSASRDSLKTLYGVDREDVLDVQGMWMEAIVRGKLSTKGQFCKHILCTYQLDLLEVNLVRPAHKNPEEKQQP